ncbi:MAG: hypothetical protein KJ697_02575 [Nanoarchaeota archaeon]|nr:hypothetical protein [Nanoarchaeota archaeon]MBU4124011.1 hypothetical protein [Nanoarchaeota archaeon]
MIKYYKRTSKDRKLRVLKKFENDCWINVVDPSDDEIEYLVEKFNLDKENLISGIDKNEIPRVEFDNKTYVISSVVTDIKNHELGTFLLIVGKKFILTFMEKEPNFIEKILENKLKFVTTEKKFSMLNLMYEINEDFEKAINSIEKNVNMKKAQATHLKEKDVTLLLEYEEKLNRFASAYSHNIAVYNKINKKIKFYGKDKDRFESIVIEINEGFQLCKNSLKNISNIRNYYLILLSNRLNRIITIFTMLTVMISIPAAISGIYGMNILLPFQNDPSVIFYIIAIIMIFWAVFFVYLKKSKIL